MAKKALLLIDIQNDYFPGGDMELTDIEKASANAAALLERFREKRRPLVHVRHVFPSDAAPFFRPNSPGAQIHESVAPTENETVITKNQVNAFQQTDLKTLLEAMGVKDLVIVGAMSHMCIEGTTRAAADLGYMCEVIHDACATREQEFNGRKISAEDVHGAAMSSLGFAYAQVMSLDQWRRANE
jgi:nicotinamidase-related amidase